MEKVENKDICRECGGYCCKKCGCDYFVSDFDQIKIDSIEKVLDTGRASIVAALKFDRLKNNKLVVEPVLYLRARNVDRGEIDLLSFKKQCLSLTENGCYFDLEHRPSGGSTLIPKYEHNQFLCYSTIDRIDELKKWIPYQKVLQRVVRRRTGMDVYARLRMDAENLFLDILNENFEGVDKAELNDVLSGLNEMAEAFSEELKSAREKNKKSKFLLMKK